MFIDFLHAFLRKMGRGSYLTGRTESVRWFLTFSPQKQEKALVSGMISNFSCHRAADMFSCIMANLEMTKIFIWKFEKVQMVNIVP